MTTNQTTITIIPSIVQGQTVQLTDARRLHEFLESHQDFSDWIKNRIRKYGFVEETDYLRHKIMEQVPHMEGLRTRSVMEYHLTLDMAKELAMVERSPRGREARRYFIDCERQLKAMRDQVLASEPVNPMPSYPIAIDLQYADIHEINRQAWTDVAGENAARFHTRREELLRQKRQLRHRAECRELMELNRPDWAR